MGIIVNKPEELCSGHFLLRIDISTCISYPGQFANIRIADQNDPLLRRPFSIHDHENNTIEIIIKVIGRGTGLLRDYDKNREIDIIAPLGSGFTTIDKGRALIIGGGIGNAPLYYLARSLKQRGANVTYIYGARSEDYIFLKDKYRSIADNYIITTDDGSEGIKGVVSDVVKEIIQKESFDQIYICGPIIMIKRALDVLSEESIPVEVSIENYFGCGIGLCYGCTVDTINGLKRTCLDGPVFDGRAIKWKDFPKS